MLILLENPLLLSPAMYHVVIQQVATLLVKLPDAAWSILGEWIGRLAPPFAYRIVQVRRRRSIQDGGAQRFGAADVARMRM